MIRLKEQQQLFQEHDDGVTFIGRSLFRASVDLPVNVPIGRYTADVYLFRDGQAGEQEPEHAGSEQGRLRARDLSARFQPSLLYGLLAVLIAVLAGLAGWAVFRRGIDQSGSSRLPSTG